MALHATLNSILFLKSPGQEHSEYIALVNGTQIFIRLYFKEVCGIKTPPIPRLHSFLDFEAL